MAEAKLRVGLVGANPDRGWGTAVHVPVLHGLEDFELAAVCTTRQESAHESARRFGARHAFDNIEALVRCADVDVVAVTVKAPDHHRVAMAALDAGKHLYCEWPLATDTTQARQMRDLAERKGLKAIVGLQARAAPALAYARDLVNQGWLGRPIAAQLLVSIPGGGGRRSREGAYVVDRRHGATTVSIHGGHAIDAFTWVLGPFETLAAVIANQFTQTTFIETGETVAKTAPDQALISGTLSCGAVASVHINGGVTAAPGACLTIYGSEGVLRITGEGAANLQMAPLSLSGAKAPRKSLSPMATPGAYGPVSLDQPSAASAYPGVETPAATLANVARMYRSLAEAIRSGTPTLAGLSAGVAMHELLDLMEESSTTGMTLRPRR